MKKILISNSIFNKSKIILIIFLFIIILFVVYLIIKGNNSIYYKGPKLVGKEIINAKELGLPNDILINKGKILILDSEPLIDSNYVRIYDTFNFSFINSFGKKGGGPGEIRVPRFLINVIGKDNEFSIFDQALMRITLFDINNPANIEIKKMISLKGGMPYEPVIVNDTTIVSLAYGITEGRLAVYDMNGNLKYTIGELLPGKEKNTLNIIHNQASKGELKIKPDGTKFVLSAQYSDIIDIIDYNGILSKRIFGPLKETPKYITTKAGKIPILTLDDKNAIWGYIDIDVTDNYIVALFSGNSFKEHSKGKYVHIFDYSGILKTTFILDTYISKLAYDEESNRVFGIRYDKASVLVFEIRK